MSPARLLNMLDGAFQALDRIEARNATAVPTRPFALTKKSSTSGKRR
jgi:hypothetical protein